MTRFTQKLWRGNLLIFPLQDNLNRCLPLKFRVSEPQFHSVLTMPSAMTFKAQLEENSPLDLRGRRFDSQQVAYEVDFY